MNGPPNYRMDARERLHLLAPNRGGQGDIPLVEVRHPFQGLQDNNYGNALIVQPGQSQLLLRAHGSDDMPHTIAISAGYQLAQPVPTEDFIANNGLDVSPFLRLKFGAGGANLEYELDFLSGMILNVSATSFDLEAHNPVGFNRAINPDTGEEVVFPGWPIFAQATMGVGGSGRSSSNPARRTVVVGRLVAGASSQFPVPAGAVNFNVSTTDFASLGALVVEQKLSASNIAFSTISATTNTNFDTGIGSVSLLEGVRTMRIVNTAGAAVNNIRVLFTIAF